MGAAAASTPSSLRAYVAAVAAAAAFVAEGPEAPLTLPPGHRLGPYEIQAMVGAGGMGEVYRARDTRLDRIVALKVLSTGLTPGSSDRRQLEAQLDPEVRPRPEVYDLQIPLWPRRHGADQPCRDRGDV